LCSCSVVPALQAPAISRCLEKVRPVHAFMLLRICVCVCVGSEGEQKGFCIAVLISPPPTPSNGCLTHSSLSLSLCVCIHWPRLAQLPYKTEDLAQQMLMMIPKDRISAQDALLHPYFNTLPPPLMHLRDSKCWRISLYERNARNSSFKG